MSNSNYLPPSGYPGGPQDFGTGKPKRVPPPIPTPGGAAGFPPGAQAPYPEQPPGAQTGGPGYLGQPYGDQAYGDQAYGDQAYGSQQYGSPQYGSPQGPGGWPPTPPKKKFPLWAWLVIGVPAVVIVIAVALVSINLYSAQTADPGYSSASSDAPDGTIPLSQPAPYTHPPAWAAEVPEGWNTDQEGSSDGTGYKNSEGCYLFLSTDELYSTDIGAKDKSSDQPATLGWAKNTVINLKKQFPDVQEQPGGFTSIAMASSEGKNLQFYAKSVTYSNGNGVVVRMQMAYRAMPGTSSVLRVELACKNSVPVASSGWNEVLKSIQVAAA